MVLGIAMFYSWIHGAIIVGKKISNTTQYEDVVLVTGLVMLVLYIVGTLS